MGIFTAKLTVTDAKGGKTRILQWAADGQSNH